MIIALGLITAMFVIGYGAPRYLSVTVAPGLNPRLAITAWTASVTLVVAALIAAPVSMFTRPGRTAFGAAHACVQRLRDDGTLPWVDASQVALTAVLIGIAGYLAATVAWRLHVRRRSAAVHLGRVRALARRRTAHGGIPVLWIDSEEPTCYSVGGRSPAIIASTSMEALPAEERAAVLDHESAHVHGRHHVLIAVAEALAAAMPAVPLFREAPGAARTMVEFAADEHSARRHGAGVVGSALLAVRERVLAPAPSRGGAPATALAMAEDAVAARLCWLGTRPTRRQRLCAPADYPLAVTFAFAPVVLSVATMLTAAALVCLQLAG